MYDRSRSRKLADGISFHKQEGEGKEEGEEEWEGREGYRESVSKSTFQVILPSTRLYLLKVP